MSQQYCAVRDCVCYTLEFGMSQGVDLSVYNYPFRYCGKCSSSHLFFGRCSCPEVLAQPCQYGCRDEFVDDKCACKRLMDSDLKFFLDECERLCYQHFHLTVAVRLSQDRGDLNNELSSVIQQDVTVHAIE